MKPVVFTGHRRPIKDIKFNAEDDLLFTASIDRVAILWSTETSERIGTYSHDAAINCINITRDSKYLVSGDNSGFIYIWDVYTGNNLAVVKSDMPSGVSSIDFGVSDRQVCVTFPCRSKINRSTAMIFDIEEILKGKPQEILKSDNGEAPRKIFDLNSIPIVKVSSDTDNKITHTRFLNTNKNLLCAFDNGLIEYRDLKDNGKVLNSKQMHKLGSQIMDLNISGREELALSSAKDGQSVLFDPETLEILNSFAPDNPKRNVNSGKISPLFNPDLPENQQLRHCFIGGGQESQQVTFTKSSEGGFEVLIYEMITGEEIGAISGHFSPINALAISSSGNIVVSGGEEATIRMHFLPPEYFQMKDM